MPSSDHRNGAVERLVITPDALGGSLEGLSER
jgi:hypothetical protein